MRATEERNGLPDYADRHALDVRLQVLGNYRTYAELRVTRAGTDEVRHLAYQSAHESSERTVKIGNQAQNSSSDRNTLILGLVSIVEILELQVLVRSCHSAKIRTAVS